ncbi:outer membrane beta-barrel protein [uncultured Cyclobacterium sp.]|uniref:outer membrane beta-barrel protein n=1 Tax=uncultured Cyclobacterium sp. TaxID=453820 RepID=UPI0030EFA4B6|tara:strand:- start:64381 stop:64986 length:606 start_codon:yes stop_codon:yes gene_type:complete
MKHGLLLLFFISGVSTAFAQFDKGDLFVGGNFGFSINTTENSNPGRSTYLAINLSPNLGYFISDLSVIGINPQVNFYRNKNITSSNEKISSNSVSGGIGLFYRRYFPVVDNFYLFLEPKASYNSSFDEENKPKSFGFSLSPGASYKISPKWMVEAALGGLVYHKSYNSSGTNQGYDDSRFAFDLISTNSIGIVYFINQKDQ